MSQESESKKTAEKIDSDNRYHLFMEKPFQNNEAEEDVDRSTKNATGRREFLRSLACTSIVSAGGLTTVAFVTSRRAWATVTKPPPKINAQCIVLPSGSNVCCTGIGNSLNKCYALLLPPSPGNKCGTAADGAGGNVCIDDAATGVAANQCRGVTYYVAWSANACYTPAAQSSNRCHRTTGTYSANECYSDYASSGNWCYSAAGKSPGNYCYFASNSNVCTAGGNFTTNNCRSSVNAANLCQVSTASQSNNCAGMRNDCTAAVANKCSPDKANSQI